MGEIVYLSERREELEYEKVGRGLAITNIRYAYKNLLPFERFQEVAQILVKLKDVESKLVEEM